MDIQTQDGILLRGIPDGTPDDVIKARIQAIRGGQGPAAPVQAPAQPPTLFQKAQASIPGRVLQGARDGVDAMAQIAPRVLQGATEFMPILRLAGMDTSNPVSRFFGGEAERVDKLTAQNEKDYQAARQATSTDPGFDAARLLGNVISPANVVPAKALGAPVAKTVGELAKFGAKAGAVSAPLLSPVTDEESQKQFAQAKGLQTAAGAVTGAVLTPVLGKLAESIIQKVSSARANEMTLAQRSLETDRIIEAALREIQGTAKDVPPNILQGVRQQVNEALKTGKKLDAAALFRKQEFQKLGLEGTLGQITRDPTQFANERNLRAADPRLATRFNEQSRKLGETLSGFGAQEADEASVAGKKLIDALSNLDKQAGKQVTAAYTKARESSGREMEIPLQGLAQDLQTVIKDFGPANIPGAIRTRLGEFGLFGEKQTKAFTANDAEQVLQQINKLRGNDPAVNRALGEVGTAIKKSILAADDQGGVFAPARDLAAKRFKIQEMVPALKAAADGDASADKFVGQFLINGESDAVKTLAKVLSGADPQLYQQARSQFGAAIMRGAFGENAAGDKAIRPEMLAKTLRQIGTERLKAFFSPAEIEQMQRVARVGAWAESIPAASATNTSNSLTAALPFLAKIPGVSGGAELASALIRSAQNERTARLGLQANVPQGAADLTPQAQKRLIQALLASGTASGVVGAEGIR